MPEEQAMIETAAADSPVDSSTTSPASEETATADPKPINQEAVDKRFNKITAQKYEQQTRADTAERELADLRLKMSQPAPAEIQVEAPQSTTRPSQDLLYEDEAAYNKQMDAHNTEMIRSQIALQQESVNSVERQRVENERIQTENTAIKLKLNESAATHNLDPVKIDQSATVLVQRGINPQLAEILLEHPNIAPFIDFLASNPADFDQVNSVVGAFGMVKALEGLETKALQRNITSAPEPVTGLTGLPAREGDDFDKRFPNAIIE